MPQHQLEKTADFHSRIVGTANALLEIQCPKAPEKSSKISVFPRFFAVHTTPRCQRYNVF